MANLTVNPETVRQLTPADRRFLITLYEQRCLNLELAHRYIYSQEHETPAETRWRLTWLQTDCDLVESAEYGGQGNKNPIDPGPAYFLTTRGVNTVLYITEQTKRKLDPATGKTVRSVQTASALKLAPYTIPHQLGLNRFVLELKERMGDRDNWIYRDARYMPACSLSMMPDGMIEYGDMLILLEQDMGSERGKHLSTRFQSWRYFLNAPESYYANRRIVMLFLLDNVTVVTKRRNTLWFYLNACLLDKLHGSFEAYADTPQALMDILTYRLLDLRQKTPWSIREEEEAVLRQLRSLHGFTIQPADFGVPLPVTYACRLTCQTPEHTVQEVQGRRQEYLLDFWLTGELSVLHKLAFHDRIQDILEETIGRRLSYLVVVPELSWIHSVLMRCSLSDTELRDVYFTTPKRLFRRPFPEALFQVDSLGGVWRFRDRSLGERVFERHMGKKGDNGKS